MFFHHHMIYIILSSMSYPLRYLILKIYIPFFLSIFTSFNIPEFLKHWRGEVASNWGQVSPRAGSGKSGPAGRRGVWTLRTKRLGAGGMEFWGAGGGLAAGCCRLAVSS